jgi:DNA-damage-inducible protein J
MEVYRMTKTKSASVNVRMYPELKAEAESVFAFHGLSLPDAINVFLNHACHVGGFPFNLRDARWNDPVSLAALEECKQMENDPNAKRFRNMDALIADLEDDSDE